MKKLSHASTLGAVMVLAALSGCGQSIEKHPLFKDQQKIVARLDDDTKRIGLQVEDIAASVNSVKQEVREMKNSPRAGFAGNKDLDQHIKQLDQSIAELQKAVNEQVSRLAKVELGGRRPDSIRQTASASESDSSDEASEKSAKAKSSKMKSVAKTSRPAEEKADRPEKSDKPAKPRGSYYQVKPGESAEEIASAHKITVDKLLAENHIPTGRKLISGQQIYVPATN